MNWATVLKTKNNIEAELLVNSLENQGIGAMMLNNQVSGYPWIGYVEVKVLEEFKAQVEEIMAKNLTANSSEV